jgi:hypothetical protein
MPDYIATRRITAPGQYVAAYQQGDGVPAEVVTSWGLQVPDDVEPAEGYQAPRPAENSNDRAAWEAYVTGQGTTLDDARAASIDELRDLYDAPPPEPTPAWQVNDAAPATQPVVPVPMPQEPATPVDEPQQPERPAQSAAKSEWVDWAVAAGADKDWAHAKDTTKDDLMNYGQDA